MNIRFIQQTDELKGKNFIFRKLTFTDIPDASDKESLFFNGFIIGFCANGRITIRINTKEQTISDGVLFVVLPKHTLTLFTPTSDVQIYLLFVTFELVQQLPVIPDLNLLRKADRQPFIRLDVEKQEELISLYSIIQHYMSDNNFHQSVRHTLICSFLLIITSQFDIMEEPDTVSSQTRQDELSRDFFKLLFQYAHSGKNASFYADQLCISTKYLSAVIKRTSGFPVQEWINEVTLAEAKRYLRTSTLSVAEIARKLHFTNASSFIRFFRKHMASTPLEYRKK